MGGHARWQASARTSLSSAGQSTLTAPRRWPATRLLAEAGTSKGQDGCPTGSEGCNVSGTERPATSGPGRRAGTAASAETQHVHRQTLQNKHVPIRNRMSLFDAIVCCIPRDPSWITKSGIDG